MASAPALSSTNSGLSRARRAMIESQLRPSGISKRAVLDAFARTAREDYLPKSQRDIAYMDRQIPLPGGRAIAAPLAQAWLLSEANPSATDRALLIGGATGYLASMLAPLVQSLDVVESDSALTAIAPSKAGNWHEGVLAKGWKRGAPYDLILIDGAIEQLPSEIANQLSPNGRIVTGIADRGIMRVATGRPVAVGKKNRVSLQPLAEVGMPQLAEFNEPKGWSF